VTELGFVLPEDDQSQQPRRVMYCSHVSTAVFAYPLELTVTS